MNASPSVTADTQLDYDLKHAMLNDVFDLMDMEKKYENLVALKLTDYSYRSKDEGVRPKVGGFDLVYNDGPVKHVNSSSYSSYIGNYSSLVIFKQADT